MRLAVGFGPSEVSVFVSGDPTRGISLPSLFALRKGDGVRPAGVPVREMGGVGRLMAGLSQEEKKSSSVSPAGVEVSSAPAPSVIITSPGYLFTILCLISQVFPQ